MVSLKRIAADLAVSPTLVSAVLRNKQGTIRASDETRMAIQRRADELGYQPNRLAVALQQGRKGTVALFWHNVGAEGSLLTEKFIRTAVAEIRLLNSHVLLQFFNTDRDVLSALNQNLDREVDGVILAGAPHRKLVGKLRQLEADGLPVACACHWFSDEKIVNFEVDAEAQGHLATAHLLERGRRQIAFVGFATAKLPVKSLRYDGYRRALREGGVTIDPRLTRDVGDYALSAGFRAMASLHTAEVPFDAVVLDSDSAATGAMNYLVSRQIPSSAWPYIVGIDNSPIARHTPVPLTSVTAEMEQCARLAVRAIASKMKGEPVAATKVLPKLVVRESTGGGGLGTEQN